jgi:hypothetical protein
MVSNYGKPEGQEKDQQTTGEEILPLSQICLPDEALKEQIHHKHNCLMTTT